MHLRLQLADDKANVCMRGRCPELLPFLDFRLCFSAQLLLIITISMLTLAEQNSFTHLGVLSVLTKRGILTRSN
jgi:hypothetical protein